MVWSGLALVDPWTLSGRWGLLLLPATTTAYGFTWSPRSLVQSPVLPSTRPLSSEMKWTHHLDEAFVGRRGHHSHLLCLKDFHHHHNSIYNIVSLKACHVTTTQRHDTKSTLLHKKKKKRREGLQKCLYYYFCAWTDSGVDTFGWYLIGHQWFGRLFWRWGLLVWLWFEIKWCM